MKRLSSLFFFLISSTAVAGTQNDKACIEWMTEQFPGLSAQVTYLSDHDLLIEKIPTPKGNVSLIHTQRGSVASVPFANNMDCEPKRSVFGNREVKGISGYLNAALATKTSGLYVSGESRMESIRFLQSMPQACLETSYPNLTSNVRAVCKDLAQVPLATNILRSTSVVCREGLQ